jgi:hypothetical protein
MSISRRTLKSVGQSLKGLHLCKSVLVVIPTDHILRGFLLERTPYRSTYYLWSVIAPLYRPMYGVTLNYSTRLLRSNYIEIPADRIAQSAEYITNVIADGPLDHVKRITGPKEFLEHISWMIGNTTDPFRFDYAMTHYMLGNHAKCLSVLEELVAEPMPGMRRHKVFDWAQEIITKLNINPSAVGRIIEYFEHENVDKFALSPTLAPSTFDRLNRLGRFRTGKAVS